MKPTAKLITLLVLAFILITVKELLQTVSVNSDYSTKKVYNYMNSESNQEKVFDAAVKLNGGKSANACVYFVAEVLRRNNVSIPKDTCNTQQIISILESNGWNRNEDYTQLMPGDLCFTTDYLGNKNGIPTHTYFFMGWVEEGSYEYAYICDNQAKDYDNKIYHIRNISIVDEANGFTKDAFSFFMRPS
ncbi:hypothetical protein [Clostridium thermarum]|uniref:hypothetical protein n=1 Tax=Clostridium thermarum TaxID=1716543 RepID=UPI0013D0F232|nr:hypothetical protein [Clostridium thermarum]